jgi:hypothetical protein
MVWGKAHRRVSDGKARGKQIDSYVSRLSRWPRLCVRRDVVKVGNGERIGTGRLIGRHSSEIRSRGHAAGSVAIDRLRDAGRLQGCHLFSGVRVEIRERERGIWGTGRRHSGREGRVRIRAGCEVSDDTTGTIEQHRCTHSMGLVFATSPAGIDPEEICPGSVRDRRTLSLTLRRLLPRCCAQPNKSFFHPFSPCPRPHPRPCLAQK